ncbi:MAG: hypothetical protein IPN79_01110 [Saprospiraceae bacterium]|nr:hypothetical protein [Saprospiraceae bacterium]
MEYFLPLYPEQKSILEHWHQVKSITYIDDDMVLSTLLESCLQSIKRREKSIIVIPDASKRNRFIQLIADFYAEKLCLVYDPNSSVSKEDIINLQQIISLPKNVPIPDNYLETTFDLNEKSALLSEILQKYHLPQGDRTFLSVLERLHEIATFDNQTMIRVVQNEVMPEMDEAQFDTFYDKIILASKQYHAGYYHVKQQRTYNIASNFSKDESSIDEFLFLLQNFRDKLTHLRNEYYQFMENSLDAALYHLEAKKSKSTELIHKLSFFVKEQINYQNEKNNTGLFQIFSGKKESSGPWFEKLKNNLRESDKIFMQMEGFKRPYLNLSDFEKKVLNDPDYPEILIEQIDVWYQESLQKQVSILKYSNIFNQKDNQELQRLETSLFQLIESFNQEGLFDIPLEINTLSLHKQTELLNNYILECAFMYADITENKGYHLWHSFLQQLSECENKCIQWLRHFPSEDWPNIVESIYLIRWIHFNQPSQILHIPDLIKEIGSLHTKIGKEWALFSLSQKIKTRDEVKKSFENTEKNLFQSIVQNKGIEKLNWRYFFEKNASFFGKYIDIVITTDDSFEDMKQGIFSNIFYLDKSDINTEVLHHGKTIHSYFNKDQFGNIPTDLTLNNSSLSGNNISSGLASVDKLKKSQALSYNFYSLQQKFVFFQLKHANIISCLQPTLNSRLMGFQELAGMKESLPGSSPLDRLVECLVEDTRKQILLIQDYMLNPKDTSTIMMQHKTIEDFRDAGFMIGVVETKLLIKDYQSSLKSICQWIV